MVSTVSLSSSFSFSLFHLHLLLLLLPTHEYACNQDDLDSLLSFYHHINLPRPLNWTTNCCDWEGIGCDGQNHRVNRVWLPGRALSGTISPSLSNLSFLSHLNLSHNRLSGPLPPHLLFAARLHLLDLSFNSLLGAVLESPHTLSLHTLDLSSNHFNGSIHPSFFHQAPNLIFLNVSNNSFAGPIPSSICRNASSLKVLDFSVNNFSDQLSHGLSSCSNLAIFRAGFNALSGWLPYDLFSLKTLQQVSLPSNQLSGSINHISLLHLSNLTLFELHGNQLTGDLPDGFGFLTNLEKLLLHTNNFTGSLPPSLMNCTRLKVLLLRNNMLEGGVSALDFSRLEQLQSIDLGQNKLTGSFPASLCRCRSLNAVRLAFNNLEGELPPCISQIQSLSHISLSNNFLVNATGALRILMGCTNLTVIFMSRTFLDESLPDDQSMGDIQGFQNLEILTLGGGRFTGEIPTWIAKLKKLKVLNLSFNKISGPVPAWLGSMPCLLVINFTSNHLSGQLPRQLGNITALSAEAASTDFSYLALPFVFSTLEYSRLFNLPRGLKFGGNNLSGTIPEEIGRLKQLQILDLNDNNLSGGIPRELSDLVNLEKMDLSDNHLTGEIPASLSRLNFFSSFSVANNELEGEIPRGGQFDTFPASSFEGNPKLCGSVIQRRCTPVSLHTEDEDDSDSPWFDRPLWLGFLVGFAAVCITLVLHTPWRNAYFNYLNSLLGKVIKINCITQNIQIVHQTDSSSSY